MWGVLTLGLIRGGLFALMAVGLALERGVMRVSNFAHGEFYMLGAYAGYFSYVYLGGNPILSIVCGAVGGCVAGVVAERLIFRSLRVRTKEDWVISTAVLGIGLSYVLRNGAQATIGVKRRGITYYWQGLVQIGSVINISKDRVAVLIIAVVAISTLWLFLTKSRVGRAIRAVAQNEEGAQLVGIDLDRIHLLTFALSSALAGMAGAALLSIIPAYPTMGATPNMKSWYVMLLAGLGNVGGAVVGGFSVGILEASSYYFLGGSWQDVLSLLLIVVILVLKPSGIFGSKETRHS